MGLLDDAIREHLELKRRRGADPGEVAREQREALDTPYQPLAERQEGVADELSAVPAAEADVAAAAASRPVDALDGAPSAGAGAVGVPDVVDDHELIAGETAELDMSTVLANDTEDSGAAAEEDSLEWETPPRGEVSREVDPSTQPRVE
jgi:hypothetical protein